MAHVNFDVLVLEVERMLPNVDTDERNVSKKRVLVGSRGNLETPGGGVKALYRPDLVRTSA